MTRSEAIAIINAELAACDDARLLEIAEMVSAMGGADASRLPRDLTARELALIEQSKEDFKAGRTMTLDEVSAFVDAGLAARRAARSSG